MSFARPAGYSRSAAALLRARWLLTETSATVEPAVDGTRSRQRSTSIRRVAPHRLTVTRRTSMSVQIFTGPPRVRLRLPQRRGRAVAVVAAVLTTVFALATPAQAAQPGVT